MLSRIRNFVLSPFHFAVLVLARAAEFALQKQGLILYGTSASANTLTNLIPYIYAGLDVVSRELIGFIPAVTRDSNVDAVALNQTVNVPVVGAITPVAITPANVSPDTGGMTPGNVTITISNQYQAPIAWSGDEELVVDQTGLMNSVMTQRFAQAFRATSNLVEADLAALHVHASRAFGVYNVQPFATASNFTEFAGALKVLEDNGAPAGDLHTVFGTAAIANIRGLQSLLFKVNEAGTSDLLRRGVIGEIMGSMIHTSGQIKRAVTVGTSNNAGTTDTAGYAVGIKSIVMAAAGTGTILAGDIVTFTGDLNKYVVETGVGNLAAGGTMVLAEPGLMQAVAASNVTVTVIAATDRNMIFHRSAIVLATRAPYMPKGGDAAVDVHMAVDPVSGLAFQIALYNQYRQKHIEVGLAWGCKMVAPRHTALIIG